MDTSVKVGFDAERMRIFEAMKSMEIDSKEYLHAIEILDALAEANSKKSSTKVSPDTIAIAATNLAGILLILNYERLNVITTRAIGFILRKSV